MRIKPPSPRRLAFVLALAAAMALTGRVTLANPGEDADPVLKLLADKGMLAPTAPTMTAEATPLAAPPGEPRRMRRGRGPAAGIVV